MKPKISFGIIVINGEPFIKYCLRSIYPFAYEIIVVEGGNEGAKAVATVDGHSIDGTLEALKQFKREEDPENKVKIITRDGFWPKKIGTGDWRTLQSCAYAEMATGDYLWQIDIDEFYKPEDMGKLIHMLAEDHSITAVSFNTLTFWGALNYTVDSWMLRRGYATYHRLFKWGPGYQYIKHEPPTVVNDSGQDLRTIHWVGGDELARQGINLYHYSLLFPWQVKQKTKIYQMERPDYCKEIVNWAEHNYFRLENPYRVHNIYTAPSWLERYDGTYPPELDKMMIDIASGKVKTELKVNDDVEAILDTWWYPLGRRALKGLDYVDRIWSWFKMRARKLVVSPIKLVRQLIN